MARQKDWWDFDRSRNDTAAVSAAILGISALAATGEWMRRSYRDRRVFLPDPLPLVSWSPHDYELPHGTVEEVEFQSEDGHRLHGWYCRAEEPVVSAFYCHGNRGNLTYSAHAIPHFLRAGISVFLFDYRGYGRSSGSPSPAGVVRDARAAALVHEQLRPRGVPAVAYGYSLGGPIAAATVLRGGGFHGLVVQSSFTTLREIIRMRHPRLRLDVLSGNPFDTVGLIRQLPVPLLVIHGDRDEVCPPEMGRALFEAAAEPWRLHIVEGAHHNNIFAVGGDHVRALIREFAASIEGRPPAPEPLSDPDTLANRTARFLRTGLRRLNPAF